MSHTLNINKTTEKEYVSSNPVTKEISLAYFEKNRYGVMVVLILVVGCLGGISVGVGALTQVFSLSLLALTTMTSLSMMLAVAPMKAILYTSALAILVDMAIIVVNLVA